MQNEKDFIGKIINNRYKIKKVITHGGMNSTIYEGESIAHDDKNYLDNKCKKAAIKIIVRDEEITNDVWQRTLDEIVTLSRMSQKQNVIKLYDAVIEDDRIIIVMELVDGSSLEKKINEYGCFSIEESIYLFKEILLGVEQLHNNSFEIIHRDLKPSNILLLKNQTEIRIIDFGISSVIDKTIPNKNPEIVTNEESIYGTLTYVSPDILKLKNTEPFDYYKKITRQFDFHALGIILHELLTGEKPFYYEDEDDPICLTYFIKYDFLPLKLRNPLIPNCLENIIFKLTASKDEDLNYRYSNIREILDDIKKYEDEINLDNKEPLLLKKIENRTFQNKVPFLPKTLQRYNKKWFIIRLSFVIGILVIFFFLLFITYLVKHYG
ncbi:MAG: serine/threonine-protein kinase [Mycoplasmoidaceae bacterium]